SDGFGDMNAGLKFAFLASEEQVASLQVRTYVPTGMPKPSFLGTGHVTINPSILYYKKLTDRLIFEGDIQDYIPIGGSDFAGNVIRYGAGLSYRAFEGCRLKI